MSYNIFATFYDRLTENVRYDEYAEYLKKIFEKYCVNDGIILDAACGTGSITKRLSGYGYDMIGVDMSEDMLSVAKEKSDGTILYLCQDLAELDLYGTIDGAVCTLDSINHIEDEEILLRAFEKISLFMNKGGIFVFDVNTLYKHKYILADNTFVYDLDDIYCVWQNFFNDDDNSVDIELDFFEKKNELYERHFESFSEFYYSEKQIRNNLEKSGFEILEIFDNLSFESAKENSERIIYIARKK